MGEEFEACVYSICVGSLTKAIIFLGRIRRCMRKCAGPRASRIHAGLPKTA